MPEITDPVVIDGYSQPGARPNSLDVGDDAVLKINLYDMFGFREGLTITAGNSTVRGLVFTNFSTHALKLTDKGGDVITGNFFGLPASGERLDRQRDRPLYRPSVPTETRSAGRLRRIAT